MTRMMRILMMIETRRRSSWKVTKMNQTNNFRLPPWGEEHRYENKPNSLTPHILANEVNSTVQALIVQDPVGVKEFGLFSYP